MWKHIYLHWPEQQQQQKLLTRNSQLKKQIAEIIYREKKDSC